MQEKKGLSRLIIIGLFLVLFVGALTAKLVDLQIVHGEEYAQKSERRILRSYTVKAARGEIVDRYGRPLVSNRMVFTVWFDYIYWDKDNQNEVILKLAELLRENGADYTETLPLAETAPFGYTYASEESSDYKNLQNFLEDAKGAPKDPTAAELLDFLIAYYQIDPNLPREQQRMIAGVRYEMQQRGFSGYNTFTFANDISMELVSQISERHLEFPGVDIGVEEVREYRTDYAAHILGSVGTIYKENYPEYKEKGYPMDAIVGRDGMEKALEDYLRGINGVRSVETNVSGKVTSEISTKDPQPGDNCMLTLDIGLQEVAERSLEENINLIRQNGEQNPKLGAADIEGGAAVAIKVDSGETLALANYPSYSLKTFNADYNDLLQNELKPFFNRAIQGEYPPGSTFKMVTALAGLEEGIVRPGTVIRDEGVYRYYAPDYTPACWIFNDGRGTHGNQTVAQAIENSCNYYFYEVGRLLTIERLNNYAKMLGLGMKTGIELPGEEEGNLAGPESREAKGGDPWQLGETIQAAIGQSEQQFTPIQLANYVATLVNGGTRYQTHLLKSVKSYDYSSTVEEIEPVVLDDIAIDPENYEAIMQGMRSVAENGTASSVFRNYPIEVGGKTGSAQTRRGRSAHGVFVAFAPYDDPEIAICVIGEYAGSGNRMAHVAKDMLDYYFKSSDSIAEIAPENTILE